MHNKIKIQHYVPRFYLSNFAHKQKEEFIINCFEKPKEKAFSVNIKKIGAEKYFYDSSFDKNQEIEKSLGRFESKFNIAYNKIIKNLSLSVLSQKEKISFAYFIATQEVRTKEFRELIKDSIRQLKKRLSNEKLSKELERQIKEVSIPNSIKSMHLKILIKDTPTFASSLLNMKWVLFINKTNLPCWTSDHPVNRYNPIDLTPYGNLGLLSPGIQIYFPLSYNLSLCICDPTLYSYLPEIYEITDKQNIIFLNHLQVKSSTRHIFSINDDFSLAKRMVKDHPYLKDIDRKRIIVN